MRRSWSKDAVVSELKLRQAKGLSVERSVVVVEDRPLCVAARTYFGVGGWYKALEKAGLSATPKIQTWSPKKVVATIRKLHRLKQGLSSNFIQVHHAPLYQAALRYFKSWGVAVRAASFDYSRLRVRRPFRRWSKKAVLSEMRKKKKEGALHRDSISTMDDRGLYHAAIRYFGSDGWKKALKGVGLKPIASPNRVAWTRELVLVEIYKLLLNNTRLPAVFLEKNGYWGLITAARKLFGSWRSAIVAAGIDFERVKAIRQPVWTKERVIAEIQHLDQIGVRLNHKNIRETRCDLLGSAINRFGSWSQAVYAAGFDYREHCLVWSTKAWLRQLSDTQVQELEERATILSTRRRKRS